jgi:hypothetical protein
LQFFGEIAIRFIAGKSANKRRASHDKQTRKAGVTPGFSVQKMKFVIKNKHTI